jgi:hypothetical protein
VHLGDWFIALMCHRCFSPYAAEVLALWADNSVWKNAGLPQKKDKN